MAAGRGALGWALVGLGAGALAGLLRRRPVPPAVQAAVGRAEVVRPEAADSSLDPAPPPVEAEGSGHPA